MIATTKKTLLKSTEYTPHFAPPCPDKIHSSQKSSMRSLYRARSSYQDMCRCTCHRERTVKTPQILHAIAGRLFAGVRGLPSVMSGCDEPTCEGQDKQSFFAHYRLPQWWLKSSILPQLAVIASLTARRFVLELPRILDHQSPAFEYALMNDVKALQVLFKQGLASSHDISGDNGRTLLHYALIRSALKRNNSLHDVRFLLEQGADPRLEDANRWAPADAIWDSILSASTAQAPLGHVFEMEVPMEHDLTDPSPCSLGAPSYRGRRRDQRDQSFIWQHQRG